MKEFFISDAFQCMETKVELLNGFGERLIVSRFQQWLLSRA